MIKFKNINWYLYYGALIPKVPPHYEITLTKKEQKELLKISRALFLRYTNEWDRDGGEFWYIIKDKYEKLEDYNSNNRRKIRKGLKNCIVKKVNIETISNYGYEVYITAMNKYKTTLNIVSEEEFKKNKVSSKNYDFWAVYNKDNIMIAYSSNKVEDNSCNYMEIKFHPDYLRFYSSYAIFSEMNRYYINEKKLLYVNDGARSISHETNIQQYLEDKFDFRKAYCKLNVIYRWDIGLAVKILYPFRGVFNFKNSSLLQKISVILKQEEIRRSFEKY